MSGNAMAGETMRFGADVTLADMRLAASGDGHYLLIYCRRRIVAILGSMGGNVERFEFADAGHMTAMELIERIAPTAEDQLVVPAGVN